MGAAKARRRRVDGGKEGEIECVWSLLTEETLLVLLVKDVVKERRQGSNVSIRTLSLREHLARLPIFGVHQRLCLCITIWPTLESALDQLTCPTEH